MLYKTKGTCSSAIRVELDGNQIRQVEFIGGCSGNTQGIAALVQGMDAREAIERLKDIRCGVKPTSCPQQLSFALRRALEKSGK